MTLQAILYDPAVDPSLQILDQLLLPHTTTYIPITCCRDAFHAICRMRVRGAPAIAIVAALSLAVEITYLQAAELISSNGEEVGAYITEKLDYLMDSRPTAVNLGDAVGKLKTITQAQVTKGMAGKGVSQAYVRAAERMLQDDLRDNELIGKHGAEWILAHAQPSSAGNGTRDVSVLTHCNTG